MEKYVDVLFEQPQIEIVTKDVKISFNSLISDPRQMFLWPKEVSNPLD